MKGMSIPHQNGTNPQERLFFSPPRCLLFALPLLQHTITAACAILGALFLVCVFDYLSLWCNFLQWESPAYGGNRHPQHRWRWHMVPPAGDPDRRRDGEEDQGPGQEHQVRERQPGIQNLVLLNSSFHFSSIFPQPFPPIRVRRWDARNHRKTNWDSLTFRLAPSSPPHFYVRCCRKGILRSNGF